MHKVLSDFFSSQFACFLITGGIAAGINFGSRFFFNTLMPFGPSILAAHFTGMLSAFIMAKVFVFEKSRQPTGKAFLYFTLVNVASVAQTYFISVSLAEYLFPAVSFSFMPHATAHAAGIIIPVFTSFIGHKYLSFRGETTRV